MDPQIERQISQLLKQWSSPEKVAEVLLARLTKPDLTPKEERTIFNFLLQSGCLLRLLKPLQERVEKALPVPWCVLVETFAQNKIRPNRDLIDAIFTGALEQQALEDLIQSHSWEDDDGRFASLRKELQERLRENLISKKNELKEKLGFLVNHRMVEEEEKVLQFLLRLSPEDSEIQAHNIEFQERWARNILARQTQTPYSLDSFVKTPVRWSEKESELLNLWLEETKKIANKHPEQAYFLCLFFYFLEAYDQAFTTLQLAPDSPQKNWLILELLIQCRCFVECLAAIDQVELAYADNPETTFGAAYVRARALRGLGQTPQALEILQGIINIRPNYRSAQALIHEWARGAG